jgi:hypothetical protein
LEVGKTQDCCSRSEAKRRKKERKKARWMNGWVGRR